MSQRPEMAWYLLIAMAGLAWLGLGPSRVGPGRTTGRPARCTRPDRR